MMNTGQNKLLSDSFISSSSSTSSASTASLLLSATDNNNNKNTNNQNNSSLMMSISTISPMINSTSNKLKTYLIEKLLNESTNSNTNNTSRNEASILAPSSFSVSRQLLKQSNMELNDGTFNNLKNVKGLVETGEGKEDLVSEAGTYTIDDNPDENLHAKDEVVSINNKQSIDLISARAAIDEKFGIIKRPLIDESLNDSQITDTRIEKLDTSQNESIYNKPNTPSKRATQKIVRERNKTYSLSKDVLPDNNYQNDHKNEDSLNSESRNNESVIKKTTTYDIIPNSLKNIDEQEDLGQSFNENGGSSLNTSMTAGTLGTNVLIGDTEKLIEELKKRRMEKKTQLKARLQAVNGSNVKHAISSSSSSSCASSLSHTENEPSQNEVKTAQCWTIPNNTLMSLNTNNNNNNSNSNNNSEDPFEVCTSRATIGTSTAHKIGNGGMAFDFILTDNNVANKETDDANSENESSLTKSVCTLTNCSGSARSQTSAAMSISRGFERRSIRSSVRTDEDGSTIGSPKSGVTNASTALSLGAKIANKAKENNNSAVLLNETKPSNQTTNNNNNNNNSKPLLVRRSSGNSLMTNNTQNGATQYTNRTLYLRQQSAKAKRDSLEKPAHSHNNNHLSLDTSLNHESLTSHQPQTQQSKIPQKPNGILKKPPPPTTSNNPTSANNNKTNLNKSFTNLNTTTTTTPTQNRDSRTNRLSTATTNTNNNTNNKQSRSSSRNASPYNSSSQKCQSLMTSSLTLPSGSSIDSFQRRKNYNPSKAVENDRLKKQQGLNNKAGEKSLSKNSIESNEEEYSIGNNNMNGNNLNTTNSYGEEDSTSDSSLSFSLPVHSLTANLSNKQLPAKTNSKNGSTNNVGPSTTTITTRAPLGRSYSYRESTAAQPQTKPAEKAVLKSSSIKRGQTLSTIPDSILKQRNEKSAPKPSMPQPKKQQKSLESQEQTYSSTHSLSSSYSSLNGIPQNPTNVNTYEKILQSTLQRLCIRLIQLSTGVLDKIGDNSTKLCEMDNANTELERMQQLAKLVHSMQLVHDHVQIIDSTLFNPKPEEAYMKELSRIRQEVDNLKHTAALNSTLQNGQIASNTTNNQRQN